MASLATLEGSRLWSTELSTTPEEYTIALTAADRAEIKNALDDFKSRILGLHDVSQKTFPLPKLGKRLMKASEKELHDGKGFFVIKGLNHDTLTAAESSLIYLGITSYIGDKKGIQNFDGDVIVHVTDSKFWSAPEKDRHGINSKKSLPFHCDMGADILSLHARDCAQAGGSTYLASAWSVYNDLASTQPEALSQLLSNTWPVQTTDQGDYFLAPLMQVHEGKLVTSFDPARLGPHPNYVRKEGQKDVPELTPEQKDALKALDQAAKRNEIGVTLQKGDVLFLNNWAILHRRDEYKDSDKASRHLVRLWTRNTKLGWAIPQSMAIPWKETYDGARVKVFKADIPEVCKISPFNAGSAAADIKITQPEA